MSAPPLSPTDKSSKLTPLVRRRKIAMLDAGVTAADVARAVGVSRQAVSDTILGEICSRRVAEKLAELTGKPLRLLFPDLAA